MMEKQNTPALKKGLEPAVYWQDKGLFSSVFDEKYFSTKNGLEEAHYVFAQGNNLEERFATRQNFSIGELGFGTGLNFFMAYDLWCKKNKKGVLYFSSCEKYPLPFTEVEKIGVLWPHLKEYIKDTKPLWQQLQAKNFKEGWYVLTLKRAVLKLYLGDVQGMFSPFISSSCDAWFLDGFSPKKNSAMWQKPILKAVARHCSPKATLATFTAASHIRHDLAQEGFLVKKIKGYRYKRHMTVCTRCVSVGED